MAGSEIFSTVLRGYKKEEVSEYIAGLSEQLEQLKQDLDRKELEIHRLSEEIKAVESAPKAPDEQQLAALRAEIEAEVEEKVRAEYETKLAEELAKQAESAPQAELSETERKAQEYDACRDALADLMIQARKNADEVVSKANAEAQMLRAKSEAEFVQLGAAFSVLQQSVGNIRLEFQKNLDMISEQVDAFEEKLFELQKEVEGTVGSLHTETAE